MPKGTIRRLITDQGFGFMQQLLVPIRDGHGDCTAKLDYNAGEPTKHVGKR